jgi:uncharacterized protein YgfB (UPF0149 family)
MDNAYQALQGVLQRWGADLGAAELHGQVVGWLCGDGPPGDADWLALLGLEDQFGAATAEEASRVVNALADASWQALQDTDLGFQPLLPDDERPLAERVGAMLQWSRGFLGGLGLSGFRADARADGVAEFLTDLGSIAGSAIDVLDDDEEGEMAYVELIEFLRMGSLLVHLSGQGAAA